MMDIKNDKIIKKKNYMKKLNFNVNVKENFWKKNWMHVHQQELTYLPLIQ